MLHSVPAVYNTATNRPQMLISRRRSSSRMNLDSVPKKSVSFSKEDEVLEIEFRSEGLINPMFRMRFQNLELPVQALHFPAGKRRSPLPNLQSTSPNLS
ncbi:uncharacterized protein LOC120432106 isoform X2 [Culex pipiens pallens]|uniref:uncharacterized protein LOC120432106 isoform X2 n=1 Tax=Culex pipiens pallens TaxID=42434 RepID=UPI0022AAAD5D|nr:uncharacterized protein LOC120432106 isoform X2 [Culex pipiens pallens]